MMMSLVARRRPFKITATSAAFLTGFMMLLCCSITSANAQITGDPSADTPTPGAAEVANNTDSSAQQSTPSENTSTTTMINEDAVATTSSTTSTPDRRCPDAPNTATDSRSISSSSGGKTPLFLAAFFPFGGGWDGSGVIPAVEMAFDHINGREDVLQDYELKMVWKDTQVRQTFD